MKKIFLLLFTAFLFSFSLSSCENEKKEIPKKEEIVEKYKLKSEDFNFVLNLNGTLQANAETPVASKQSGRISELNFEIGDLVLKNTLLGKLAGDESKVNFQTAQTNEINLKELLNSQKRLLDEGVNNAKKSLELAEENLKAVETQKNASFLTTNEAKKLAEKKMQEAKISLENIEKTNKQNILSIYKNADGVVRNGLLTASIATDFLDSLFGITNKNKAKNISFKTNLGDLNPDLKFSTLDKVRTVLVLKNDFKTFYDLEIDGKNPEKEKIDLALEKNLELLEDLQIVLKQSYSVLENSSSLPNYGENLLEEYKIKNLEIGKTVEFAILNMSSGVKSGVKGVILGIKELKIQNENQISSAKSALESAKQSLVQVGASSDQNFSNVFSQKEISKKQVEQAQIALKTAIASKESSLKDLKSKIDLASLNKNLFQVAIGNTQIGAPFSGVITEKIAEVGQVVSAGQVIYKVADTSGFKIFADISDTKIGKLKIGQKALVKVDGVDGEFEAILSNIAPKLDPISRNIFVEFKLKSTNSAFKIGAFSRINLIIEEKNAFLVPSKFIKSDFDGNFILLKNGEKQFVKIGEEIDGKIKIWWNGEMEGFEIIK